MLKAIKGEGEAVLLELFSLVSSVKQQELTVPVTISMLLAKYTNVFSEQVCSRDHVIVFQPGSGLVNVRSYR